MRASNYLVALATLVFVAGCTSNESAPPLAGIPPEETQAESPSEQTEVKRSGATPEQQDESPGLAIGEKAPAFDLKDQNGQNQALADILESGHTALVFYRSADW